MTDLTLTDREAAARTALTRAERVLCDLDGCLISGERLLPGALAFVSEVRDRLHLVSNNSTDTARSLSARLGSLGLKIAPERIVLAGEVALQLARNRAPSGRILMLAGADLTRAAEELGLDPWAGSPDLVLLCRDTQLSLPRLEAALHHLARGVPLIVANPDLTHPGPQGPALETGALSQLLECCVAPSSLTVVGKPEPGLFRAGLQGCRPEDAVMIGDNPDTDIAGAEKLGMPAIRVGLGRNAGIQTLEDLAMWAAQMQDEERFA